MGRSRFAREAHPAVGRVPNLGGFSGSASLRVGRERHSSPPQTFLPHENKRVRRLRGENSADARLRRERPQLGDEPVDLLGSVVVGDPNPHGLVVVRKAGTEP